MAKYCKFFQHPFQIQKPLLLAAETIKKEKTATFLIRKKDDILARAKAESLKEKFQIEGITNLKYGVIWNITVNKGNFKSVLNQLINTQILFNTLSHECYRIN